MLFLLPLAACTGPAPECPCSGPAALTDDTSGDTDDSIDTSDSSDTSDTSGADDTSDTSDTSQAPYPAPCEAWGTPAQTGALANDALNEVSGVAPSQLNPGVLWVMEDRGGHAEIYAIDPSGASLGTLTVEGVENSDWEDLALTPCDAGWCIWVADTGNNNFDRTELSILRIAEPLLDGITPFVLAVTPEVFAVRYPDETQDAEALLITPEGMPVLFTKRDDGTSRMYGVPTLDSTVVTDMEPLEIVTVTDDRNLSGRTTAADLWPDGSRVMLRTYGYLWEYRYAGGGYFESMDDGRVAAPSADERQGEAVAYDVTSYGYWQIGEGVNAPVWFTGCAD